MARNRKELLDLIIESAITTLKAKAACFYLAGPGRGDLAPVAYQGLPRTFFDLDESPWARRVAPRVLKGEVFSSRDAAAELGLRWPEGENSSSIGAVLAVPVMVKGKNIGALCLLFSGPRDFSAEEPEFLTFLAQQAGGVIEHGRVIDQLRSETKLFLDLAVNLSSSLEVKEILRAMSADLAVALGVKGASIRLLDEDKQTLELVAAYGLSEKYLQKGPVSARKSIAQALNGQKPVVIENAATDRRVQYRKMNKEEGIVTILSVPIKTKERVIGVLRLYSAVKRAFAPDEIMLVTALALLGGLAIQNASLYLMCQAAMKDLKDELWSHRSWF
jgi:GAF domain-containing protein